MENYRFNVISGYIKRAENVMGLRSVLNRYEAELVSSNSLRSKFTKAINDLKFKGWANDRITREMIVNLQDDFQGIMENPSPQNQLPLRVVQISDTYELPDFIYKTGRKLPDRVKVSIEIHENINGRILEELEYEAIRVALDDTNSQAEACKVLGISVRTLRNKLQKYEEYYQIKTKYSYRTKLIKDVVPEVSKPIREKQIDYRDVDYKLATKCEHNWKGDWLDSGKCISCYKKDKIDKNKYIN